MTWHWRCSWRAGDTGCGAYGSVSGPDAANNVIEMVRVHTLQRLTHVVEVWARGNRDDAKWYQAVFRNLDDTTNVAFAMFGSNAGVSI